MPKKQLRTTLLLLAAIIAVYLAPSALSGKVPVGDTVQADSVSQFYPWLVLGRQSLLRGEAPLWNPYAFCGSPLLANGQSALFYPVHFLFYVFPGSVGLLLIAASKLFLMGAFTYGLVRRLGVSPGIARVDMLAATFSGYMMAWLTFPISNVFCLLPASMYFALRWVREGTVSSWTGLAVVTGGHLLGGQPQSSLSLFALLVPFLVFQSRRIQTGRLARLAAAVLALTVGIALGAVQWLPQAEYIGWSQAHEVRSLFSLYWAPIDEQPITYLLPAFFGEAEGVANWGYAGTRELVAYIGVLPLLLAGLSLAAKKHRRTALLLLGTVAGLSAILYRFPWFDLISRLIDASPLLSMGMQKLLGPISFALILLSALGLSSLLDQTPRDRRKAVTVCAAVLVGVTALFFVGYRHHFTAMDLWRYELRQLGWMLAFLAAGILFLLSSLQRRSLLIGLGCVIGADLWLSTTFLQERGNPEVFFGDRPDLSCLLEQPRGRVDDLTGKLPGNMPGVFELENVSGYDALTPQPYWDYATLVAPALKKRLLPLLDQIRQENPGEITPETLRNRSFRRLYRRYGESIEKLLENGSFAFPTLHPIENRTLYNLLGARYLLSSRPLPGEDLDLVCTGDPNVYFNTAAFDRAFLVSSARFVTSRETSMRAVADPAFDPAATAILLSPKTDSTSVSFPIDPDRSVTVLHSELRQVTIETHSAQPAFLVLTDAFYPGWQVSLDGRPTTLYRADHLFRAVEVPPGRHQVVWDFNPRSYTSGRLLTLLGAAAALLPLFLPWLRRRARWLPISN